MHSRPTHHPSMPTRESKSLLRMSRSPNRFSARGAILEARIQGLTARRAYASVPSCRLKPRLPRFPEQGPAAFAFDQGASLFHTKKRHKEKGKVVIHPFQSCLVEAAGGTPPRLSFNLHGFWLNPGDYEKHFPDTVDNRILRIQEPARQVKIFREIRASRFHLSFRKNVICMEPYTPHESGR